jgi:hypothetical protein
MLRGDKYFMKIIDKNHGIGKYYEIKVISLALGDWNINNSLMG